ncbi:MAG: hypothetical protein IJH43_08840 [Mogibacterium sp.]|nr:hypothetical protein [Mogibacterium sp.]
MKNNDLKKIYSKQKKLERIIKRDRRRRRAQGIGALTGTITSLLFLHLVFGFGKKASK